MESVEHCDRILGAVSESPVVRVPPAALRPAGELRVAGLSAEYVESLCQLTEDLPPLVVHRPTMRVIDGSHRLEAAVRRGDERVAVRFFDGPERDCFLLAVRLNARHGLMLTRADRCTAVVRILGTHPDWSDRRIAALVGVSPRVVARRRAARGVPDGARVGLDGRVRGSDIAERRVAAASYVGEHPGASLREIARATGLSVGTARDVRLRLRSGRDPVPSRRPEADLPGAGEDAPAVRATCRLGRGAEAGVTTIFDRLRNDPLVRMSDQGRVLLRILGASQALEQNLSPFVAVVPPFHADSVADAARQISEVWARFAGELDAAGQDRIGA
ncbi:ParB/RepB/Spo0J family partition protein [Actinophytocola oryzae]|uniref:ParB-like nuclease family protein n=1 Tax=Actinophytocola oryzae TaxID=502181 RepID=A0A4R7VJZ8_9PSEU|nr:ParB/RepB/Spo0J family partition protein [Actinophytocola oryzae]TDV49783.1 ParB-like nuclease family protein [Actinophytocola oryzae]